MFLYDNIKHKLLDNCTRVGRNEPKLRNNNRARLVNNMFTADGLTNRLAL